MRDLFFENPMLIEVKRFWRKFFGVSKKTTANLVLGVVVVLCYGLLIAMAAIYRAAMDIQAFIAIQTFLFCLIVPSMLHGAIAAEREKRTWDLLAVAPISKAQIVVGKFISAAISILIIAVLLLIPGLLMDNQAVSERGGSIAAAEIISVGYAFFLGSICMLISSTSRRSFSAQAGIYGVQVFGLIIWPMMAATMSSGPGARGSMDFVLFLHPFYAQDRAFGRTFLSGGDVPLAFKGPVHLLVYGLLTALLLVWAVQRLQDTSTEVVKG